MFVEQNLERVNIWFSIFNMFGMFERNIGHSHLNRGYRL